MYVFLWYTCFIKIVKYTFSFVTFQSGLTTYLHPIFDFGAIGMKEKGHMASAWKKKTL